jgi:hypothetical protein
MKKTLLTIALMAVTAVASYSQGTINPLNGALTRVKIDMNGNGVIDAADRNATTQDGLQFTVVWGAAGSTALDHTVAGSMTIGTTDGVMVGLPSILALEGAGDVGTTVSLQIRASNSTGLRGQTDIKQVVLAPASGPGAVVWATAATAARFSPLLIVPEPSTIALGVLGLGSLLLFRRRK